VKGTPTLVKRLVAGIQVGYGCTYTCETDERIATFPIGYADGLWRDLGEGKSYIIRDKTGEKCPIVGRISMDAITVKLPCYPDDYELFTIMTADFDPMTSVTGLAKRLGTIENEVLIRLSDRLPRVYTTSGRLHSIEGALSNFIFPKGFSY
jgi:alanine racemase